MAHDHGASEENRFEPRDLFLSTREIGYPVLAQLRVALSKVGLKKVYCWDHTGDYPSARHFHTTNAMIDACRGAIVLVGPNYFDPPPDANKCAQRVELDKILQMEGARPDYKVLFVILQNEEGWPDATAFEKEMLRYTDLNLTGYQIAGVRNALQGEFRKSWDDDLPKIAADMARWIGLARETRQTSSSTGGLNDAERIYLESVLGDWIDGRGSDKQQTSEGLEFSFTPRRFLTLNAREIGSEESEHAGDEPKPVTHWLFKPAASSGARCERQARCGSHLHFVDGGAVIRRAAQRRVSRSFRAGGGAREVI